MYGNSYDQRKDIVMKTTATVETARVDVNASQAKTKYMVQLALMVAITLIMALTPLGYIKLPGISMSFLAVPVSVGAVMLGPVGGAICGAAFGITSFSSGLTGTFAPLAMANIAGFFCMTVVARVLEGLLTGFIFKALRSAKSTQKVSFFLASLATPLLNTFFFMSAMILFFYNTELIQGFVTALGAANPFMFVVLMVGIQGAVEAIVCTIVGTAVSTALYKIFKK